MKNIINSEKALYDHIDYLRSEFKKHKYLRTDTKTGKQRSNQQRKALQVYCRQVAEVLNDAGITFRMFFKPGFEVPWSMDIVKDEVWKPVQRALFNKESTTEPLTSEYQQIFEPINIKLSEFGVFVPWPVKKDVKCSEYTKRKR